MGEDDEEPRDEEPRDEEPRDEDTLELADRNVCSRKRARDFLVLGLAMLRAFIAAKFVS